MMRWGAAAAFAGLCSLPILSLPYNLTAHLHALACVVAFFWFCRELTDSPTTSALAAGVLGLQLGNPAWLSALGIAFAYLGLVVAGVSVALNKDWRRGLIAALMGVFFWSVAPWDLGYPQLPSLESRFELIWLALFLVVVAKFQRMVVPRDRALSTATDIPATKSAAPQRPRTGSKGSNAAALSMLAVMIPCGAWIVMQTVDWMRVVAISGLLAACMAGNLHWRGLKLPQLAFAVCVLTAIMVMLAPRPEYMPAGMWLSFLAPSTTSWGLSPPALVGSIALLGFCWLFSGKLWNDFAAGYAMPLAYLVVGTTWPRESQPLLAIALRGLLLAAAGHRLLQLVPIAWSRPAIQAPPRPSPAPGSLPRP